MLVWNFVVFVRIMAFQFLTMRRTFLAATYSRVQNMNLGGTVCVDRSTLDYILVRPTVVLLLVLCVLLKMLISDHCPLSVSAFISDVSGGF